MDDLIAEFIDETAGSLAVLAGAIAQHGTKPLAASEWDDAARLMHTIRNTCSFMGLKKLEALAEQAQSAIGALRQQESAAQFARLGYLIEQIRAIMQHLETHGSEPKGEVTAPPPAPAAVPEAKPVEATRERLEVKPVMPPAPAPSRHALVEVKNDPPLLPVLVRLRNQIKEAMRHVGSARLAEPLQLLNTVIGQLKDQRPATRERGPRVMPVLLITTAGGQRYALPQAQVLEVVRSQTSTQGRSMVPVRGQWLPLVSLHARLQHEAADEPFIVALKQGSEQLALAVRSVTELEELVVQDVPPMLQAAKLYAGAALLGDNVPCLLLDVTQLYVRPAEPPVALPKPNIEVTVPEPVVVAPAAKPAPQPVAMEPEGPVGMLLFKAGEGLPKAIALADVLRVEHLPADMVEHSVAGPVVPCRGETLRLATLPECALPKQGDLVVILLQQMPTLGIVANSVNGIMDATAALPRGAAKEIFHGSMELDGAMTEIVNAQALLHQPAEHAS